MTRYAEKTTVSSEKSRAEIETVLKRYGASAFMYAWDGPRVVIGFRASDRHIRFILPLPDRRERRFTHSSRGVRSQKIADDAWEQACRASWRALVLVIKAKLEAVAAKITTFEDEFLAHTVLPDGSTFGQWARPQLDAVYKSGDMPRMIEGPRQ